MRQLSDGERELWNDMQRDGAPDWRTLSERRSVRRKGPAICDGCGDPIEVGDRYKTITALEDGKFLQMRIHDPACPKFHAILSDGYGPPWEDPLTAPLSPP